MLSRKVNFNRWQCKDDSEVKSAGCLIVRHPVRVEGRHLLIQRRHIFVIKLTSNQNIFLRFCNTPAFF